jgi:hypothetical protein
LIRPDGLILEIRVIFRIPNRYPLLGDAKVTTRDLAAAWAMMPRRIRSRFAGFAIAVSMLEQDLVASVR